MSKEKSLFRIRVIREEKIWYAIKRVKNKKSITGLSQIVKQGKTKQDAINRLRLSLSE